MPLLVAFVVLVISISTLGGFLSNDLKILPGQANIAKILEVYQKEPSPEAREEAKEEVIRQEAEAPLPYSLVSQQPKREPEKEKTSPIPKSPLETYIKYGPREGEIIDNTNEVIFEFKGQILGKGLEGQIFYETKVLGLDNDWQATYLTERKIKLPGGVQTYTFLVRARLADLVDLTPAQSTFTIKLSPYFDKVKITGLQKPDARNNPSLITLSTYLAKGETVNMTGWTLKGQWSSFEIPASLEDVNPLSQSPTLKDVILRQGDIVYISSEVNPLGPRTWNFRPNKCTGFLTGSSNFPIPIAKNCPLISSQKLPYYLDDCCREFISTLSPCETPKFQDVKDYGLLKDDNCRYYLNSTFSYAGCYAHYYQEPNFFLSQWHIYADRVGREIMDPTKDTIEIRDKQGLLIQKYSYGQSGCKELCQ